MIFQYHEYQYTAATPPSKGGENILLLWVIMELTLIELISPEYIFDVFRQAVIQSWEYEKYRILR